jgi:hypothetical protein
LKNGTLRDIFGPKGEEITWVCGQCIMRSFMICTPHQILFGNQTRKNKKGGVCGMLGGRSGILVGKTEGTGPLGDLGVNVRLILKWILKNYDRWALNGLVSKDRDKWQVFVNTIMNLGFRNCREFLE